MGVATADIDDDGTGEIVAAETGGRLMALDPLLATIDLAVTDAHITALDTADLWRLMRRRVPPIVAEYFRGGAEEYTLEADDLAALGLIHRRHRGE